MALNINIAYPPLGFPNTGPYRIHQDWCIGDSLNIINNNFEHFDTYLISLSSLVSTINSSVATLSSNVTTCCGGGGVPPLTGTTPLPPNVVPKVSNLVEQTIGGGNTQSNVFIISDGTMRVCGKSSNGELGIGNDRTNTTIPRIPLFNPPLFQGENIASVTPQGDVIYILTTFGRLYGAGYNAHYQLGLGDNVQRYVYTRIYLESTPTVDAPTPKPSNLFVKKIIAGSGGTSSNLTVFALTNSGDVYVWGRQTEGQTGMPLVVAPNGNANYIFKPRLLTTINNVKDIVSGGNSAKQTTFFHKNDDTLWVTGENSLGSAGIGALYTAAPNTVPVYGDIKFKVLQVLAGAPSFPQINNNVKRVYCGGEVGNITSWVITNTGRVFGAGYNNVGQAIGATSPGNKVSAFTLIASGLAATDNVEYLAGHSDSTQTTMFALINTSTPGQYDIKGWGTNNMGTLGIGNNTAIILTPTPPLTPDWLTDGAKVAQICVAGDNANKATLVLDTKGRLWSTGFGDNGLLGNGLTGSTSRRNRFGLVSISPGYGVPKLIRSTNTSFGGWSNFLVLMDTGKVLGWGYDHPSSGQLAVDSSGVATSIPSFVLFHT
jgi:alpha-tubulin suppressor-like RCC1 family protein